MRRPDRRGGAHARLGVATTETKYTDEEVALILRKATDLQAQGAKRADGLDLKAIRDIAREIGVDPELVEQAANLLPSSPPSAVAEFFGGGSTYQLHLKHDTELSPEQMRGLVAVVRRVLGEQGATSEVMGAVEWKRVGEPTQVAVTIGTQEGATNVDVIADRGAAAVLTGVGSVALGLVGAAITGAIVEPGPVIGVSLLAGGATAGLGLARAIWRHNTKRFKHKLTTLADALQRQLHA